MLLRIAALIASKSSLTPGSKCVPKSTPALPSARGHVWLNGAYQMAGTLDRWSARVSANSPVDLIGPSQNVSIRAGDPGCRAANALNCRQSPAKTTRLRTCDEAPIRNAAWILSRRRGFLRNTNSGRAGTALKSMRGRRRLLDQVVCVRPSFLSGAIDSKGLSGRVGRASGRLAPLLSRRRRSRLAARPPPARRRPNPLPSVR